ncbi:NAD(P)-dependent oxidoreductase [Beijerinckia sp. L45]|uniref:NAD(P)-dependent oxidoreductase n=1 Tax=Beijerinckia sp. L45 TaxID=1641855 RepID=UPI00131D2195|nr:NAD(P)-dependent oxidoreductase [Beijerinckia sp. L45]
MSKTIAILAQGAMGAAVARRLAENGATVITCLAGRGAASRARAEAAGMVDGPLDRFATADVFLSVVPPDAAHVTAQDVLPYLVNDGKHVPYVDCNAVSPETVRRIAALAEASGSAFIDASIIGPPPKLGSTSTVFYASGETLEPMLDLGGYGLDVRPLDAGVGAASSLKMCYAGIAKGLTGLGAAMILAATREGAAGALMAEMERSQPEILGLLRTRIPDMMPKAYRWSGEMEEIAGFVGADEAATIYHGLAQLYERLAQDMRSTTTEADALERFFDLGQSR